MVCRFLQSITIPDSVTSIGNDAFCGCLSLEEIRIPKGSRIRFSDMIDESVIDKLVEI